MRAHVVVAALLGVAGVAHADSPQVGFANAARSAKGAQIVIESLRMGIANEGFRPLESGALRSALEDPFELTPKSSIDDAVSALQQAKDSYSSFEYGPALRKLQEADDVLRELPTSEELVVVVADRYLLAGLIFAGRGADAQAAESFRVVQRLDPTRSSLDAGTFRPSIVTLYKEALAARVETVSIQIETEPAGAQVWVDGALAGSSPVQIDVALGLHRFAAMAEGHAPVAKMMDVGRDPKPFELALSKPAADQRIHILRSELADTAGDDIAWKTGAMELAKLAGVDLMVLVRNAGEGVFEAAIFDRGSGELGRWLPVPSSRFYTAINPAPKRDVDVAPRTVPAAALSGQIDTGQGDTSWYSTWWGRSLIVGTAAVAIGAVVFAVTRDDSSSSVGIGEWCFGMECAQ